MARVKTACGVVMGKKTRQGAIDRTQAQTLKSLVFLREFELYMEYNG